MRCTPRSSNPARAKQQFGFPLVAVAQFFLLVMGIRSGKGEAPGSQEGTIVCAQKRGPIFNEGTYSQRLGFRLNHQPGLAMMTDLGDAGKALYEERLKLLEGLWMPAAPPWEDLSDEVKERWRSHAENSGAGDSA